MVKGEEVLPTKDAGEIKQKEKFEEDIVGIVI
jgi:hypothetical protein